MSQASVENALVTVYRRPDADYVITSERSTDGVWLISGAVVRVPRATLNSDLAEAVMAAVAPDAETVAHPARDQWSTWRREAMSPILRCARERSWSAFESSASVVSVARDGSRIAVTPERRLKHPRGAREPMIEAVITVDDPTAMADALRVAFLTAGAYLALP